MDRTATVDVSGRHRIVVRFADHDDMRDFQGASRFYRPRMLPFAGDRPFVEETEAAEVLQAAAELKSDFGVEPLRLLRRTCRVEERLRRFIEGQRGKRIEGPLRLSRQEILDAMVDRGLWDSPTLRHAIDVFPSDADPERQFLRELGGVIVRWANAVPDRAGTALLMLDDEIRAAGGTTLFMPDAEPTRIEGKDLADVLSDTGIRVVVDGRPEIEEPKATSIRRRLRRIRKKRGLSRPSGRPKKKGTPS